MWQMPLAEMLTDVHAAAQIARHGLASVRATQIEMNLPIEVRVEVIDGETTFLANLPLWRWRTDFDVIPGRLRVQWEEVAR